MNFNTLPTSDPSIVLRYRDRQYAADLIAAALLKFDLFTYLHNNPGQTHRSVCDHFDWVDRPADVLLTLCRASGFIATDSEGVCSLTDVGREYLVADSPWYLGPYYKPIADSPIFRDFVDILRTGKPGNWQAKSDGADWHESMKQEAFAADFTSLMNSRGIAFGQAMAEHLNHTLSSQKHLLDVGGGSGIYSAALVSKFPGLIATVMEQQPVAQIARDEIERHGLSDRIGIVAADMFQDPWPQQSANVSVDTILLSNLLHDWDVPEAERILQYAADVLSDNGILIIHGAIINREKDGPLPVAEYSSLLMNITQGKCYSVGEYESMASAVGFRLSRAVSTIGDRGFLEFEI